MTSKYLSSIVNFSFIAVSLSLFSSPSFAQSTPVVFNQQQCINGLVKEGLKPNQASIWCNSTQECLKESQKQGLPPETAKTVCNCTMKEYRKRYTAEKFKDIVKQSQTNPKIAKELREVGESCFESILFE
jgi:hypothetical protein